MDLELQGRVAIVTGGGMGIGKEVARFLSQEGCKVVICARRMEYLQQAAEEITAETGNEVLPLFCDTNQMSAVSDMVEAAHKHFGRIDILVNGAAARPVWCATTSSTPATTNCSRTSTPR